ncbi:hypothetical protein DV113_004177 [Geotrichum candidum]|nr:hypothetical protein DV452_000546 [Geotrichum candidum]KAF7497780.1 hypothetical protein DV113_004177 [Geotrichum candidum]
MSSILVYVLVLFLNAVNLFAQVFFAVMYSDLDYINPVDLCNRLNQFLTPEAALQAFVAVLLLLTGDWFSFLLNVPIIAYNVRKYLHKTHLLDATEIFRTVNTYKNETYAKLGWHLLLFFYYLYCLTIAIVIDESSS